MKVKCQACNKEGDEKDFEYMDFFSRPGYWLCEEHKSISTNRDRYVVMVLLAAALVVLVGMIIL